MAKRLMTKQEKARIAVREEVWPDATEWMWPGEKGWSKVPRTLSILLQILRDKRVSGREDLGPVYVELLMHVWLDGLIEIESESTHAEDAGYTGQRGLRSWRERMARLEKLGFIKVAPRGRAQFGYVMIVHPYRAVQALHREGRVDKGWWLKFKSRWTKEGVDEPGASNEAVDVSKVILGHFGKTKEKESA